MPPALATTTPIEGFADRSPETSSRARPTCAALNPTEMPPTEMPKPSPNGAILDRLGKATEPLAVPQDGPIVRAVLDGEEVDLLDPAR